LFDGIPGSESKNETKAVPNGHVAHETVEPVPPKIKVAEISQAKQVQSHCRV
jgi:hypothetical protein